MTSSVAALLCSELSAVTASCVHGSALASAPKTVAVAVYGPGSFCSSLPYSCAG